MKYLALLVLVRRVGLSHLAVLKGFVGHIGNKFLSSNRYSTDAAMSWA